MASMQDLVKSMKDKPSSKQTVRGASQQERIPSQQRTANQSERGQSQPRGTSPNNPVSVQQDRNPSQPRGVSQQNQGPTNQEGLQSQPRGASQQNPMSAERNISQPRVVSHQNPMSANQERMPSQPRVTSQGNYPASQGGQERMPSQPRVTSQGNYPASQGGQERMPSQPRVTSQGNYPASQGGQDRMPSQPRATSQQPQSRAHVSQPHRIQSQTHSLNASRQRELASGYQPQSAPYGTGEDERSVRGPSPAKSLKMSHADPEPASFSRLSNPSAKAPSISGGLVQPIRVVTPKSIIQPNKVKTPSNRTGQTRGSLKAQQEVEDDFDKEEDEEYSEYYYPEYYPQSQHSERLEPRAVTSDGPESCGCFPKRSSRHVSSMLYEHVKCVHTGLKGQTHQGVYRFEDNWNHAYEVPKERKTQMQPPDTRYVMGYPRPVFDPVSDEDDYDEDDLEENNSNKKENEKKKGSAKSKIDKNQTGKTEKKKDKSSLNVQQKDRSEENKDKKQKKDEKKAPVQKGSDKKEDDDYYDSDEDDYQELSREDKYYPIRLPQIGYSPPPSRENSRLSARSQTYLPPLPESPHLTNQKSAPFMSKEKDQPKRQKPSQDVEDDIELFDENRLSPAESVRSRKYDKPRQIERSRRFLGVYYDPVTKQRMEYNIQPKFRSSFRNWDVQLGDRISGGNRESRMPGRMSVSNSRNTDRDIPEEE